MVPLKKLERLFRRDDGILTPQLRVQRELNGARIPAIARYLADNASEYILSALCAKIDGGFAFDPFPGQRSIGNLRIDISAIILVYDGQHRRAGIIEALRTSADRAGN
jgi:DNA sulfur modification protein DndB